MSCFCFRFACASSTFSLKNWSRYIDFGYVNVLLVVALGVEDDRTSSKATTAEGSNITLCLPGSDWGFDNWVESRPMRLFDSPPLTSIGTIDVS